jgi:hypothetical protein
MFKNKLLRSLFRPREGKEQEAKIICIMRSLKISTLHQIVYNGNQVNKWKLGEKGSV